jgi:SAM-dependent methyltransferase
MLTGREHFYAEWQNKVRSVVKDGAVLDLGTSRRFGKELAWLSPWCARPYYTSDIRTVPDSTFTADARAIPLRDGSLGAVICQGVLNYLTEPQRVADEIWRVLRPGGMPTLPCPQSRRTPPDMPASRATACDSRPHRPMRSSNIFRASTL